jgi:hypothetical protein
LEEEESTPTETRKPDSEHTAADTSSPNSEEATDPIDIHADQKSAFDGSMELSRGSAAQKPFVHRSVVATVSTTELESAGLNLQIGLSPSPHDQNDPGDLASIDEITAAQKSVVHGSVVATVSATESESCLSLDRPSAALNLQIDLSPSLLNASPHDQTEPSDSITAVPSKTPNSDPISPDEHWILPRARIQAFIRSPDDFERSDSDSYD